MGLALIARAKSRTVMEGGNSIAVCPLSLIVHLRYYRKTLSPFGAQMSVSGIFELAM
jgi:hypothetical protein